MNNASAVFQLLSTLLIVLALMFFSLSLSTSEFVWTKYNNETKIESTPYVCIIGVLTSLYGFSGYEGGAHMAEETINSSSSAPKAIVGTCIVSAIAGFFYLTGLLYAC